MLNRAAVDCIIATNRAGFKVQLYLLRVTKHDFSGFFALLIRWLLTPRVIKRFLVVNMVLNRFILQLLPSNGLVWRSAQLGFLGRLILDELQFALGEANDIFEDLHSFEGTLVLVDDVVVTEVLRVVLLASRGAD